MTLTPLPPVPLRLEEGAVPTTCQVRQSKSLGSGAHASWRGQES